MSFFICIPVVTVAFYVLFWVYNTWHQKESMNFFRKRILLSFIAVAYVSYVSVTRSAMNIVSCIRVFDSSDLGSDAFSFYWPMDTSIRCYEGKHAYLAGLLGWPILFLFSLGYPVLLAFLLIRYHPTGSSGSWSYDTAGFLFRGYNSKFIFWESVIILRKALLVMIIVFGYQFESNLQEIIAVCVLAFSVKLHYVCQPFREDFAELNDFEGYSLFVSMLTFALSLTFVEDNNPKIAKDIITVFLFIGICGLVLFLTAKLSSRAIECAQFSLIADGVHIHQSKGTFNLLKTFAHSRFRRDNGTTEYVPVSHTEIQA